jgi:hypothetical protein
MWEVKVEIQRFLNFAQDLGDWSDSRSVCYVQRKVSAYTPWTGDWVSPKDGLPARFPSLRSIHTYTLSLSI